MNDIISAYLAWKKKRLAARSLVEYSRDLRFLEAWLTEHNTNLLDATRLDLETYLTKVIVGKNNRYTNRKLSVLRSFYLFLEDMGKVKTNPARRILRFSTSKHLVDSLTHEQLQAIIMACGRFRDSSYSILAETIVKTFYYTGIRLSELINMDVSSIDFNNYKIKVIGKGSKGRFVMYSSGLQQQFSAYSSYRDDFATNDPAWFISKRRQRVTMGQVEYIFCKLRTATNIYVHPHLLRHTFASHALDRGMNLEQVRVLLGHEDISSTGIYVHITESLSKSYKKAFG